MFQKQPERRKEPVDLQVESFGDVLTVKEALQKLLVVKGVTAAFIIDNEGLVMSGLGMEQGEMESIGSVIHLGRGFLTDVAQEMSGGDFQELELTFSERKLFMAGLSERFFIITVGDRSVNTDFVRTCFTGYKAAILKFLGM